ncbi:16S rRNA (guanine(966)-N(2))-methyltransferase (EC [Olavius sp. associated proteobacterium Delta 1]|nr:16S rRNA (guanine(966)-N(2))-methyltransferase (EC [Olavius sp. associated proteobacterium Delta 1]
MALRIIAGDLKGRKLRSVPGTKTRPTANRTREAIFNILASQIPGSRVLDLFAGTGAFGIEALSRKADAAVFIDIDTDSISVLQANIESLFLERQTKIIRWDLIKNLNCLHSLSIAFNLVFMDPPYLKNMIEPTLRNLHISQSLVSGTRVIVEHSEREPALAGQLPFEIADQRKYGKTLVTILDYVV